GHTIAAVPLAALVLAIEFERACPGRIGRLVVTGGALLAAATGAASLLRGSASALLLGGAMGVSILRPRSCRPLPVPLPLSVLLLCVGKWLDLRPDADVAGGAGPPGHAQARERAP